MFDLDKVNNGIPISGWFPLQATRKRKKVQGELHVQFMFLNDDEQIQGEEFSSPIHSFIRKRKLFILEDIIRSKKTDVNKKDGEDLCPLHVAAQANMPDIVKLLIEHGADPNSPAGKLNSTPLHFACTTSAESVAILLEVTNNYECVCMCYVSVV